MDKGSFNNEQELLSKIASGDEEAFAHLFDQFAPRVMHVATLFTHSISISEDIVQDVFLKLWLKRTQLPEINDFTNWIFIVARNYSINALNKIAKTEISLETQAEHISLPGIEVTSDFEARDLEKIIRKAMLALTDQQQKVFELAKLQGMGRDEIADQLGLSPNTVKMHLVRATRFVRAYLLARTDHFLTIMILFQISF